MRAAGLGGEESNRGGLSKKRPCKIHFAEEERPSVFQCMQRVERVFRPGVCHGGAVRWLEIAIFTVANFCKESVDALPSSALSTGYLLGASGALEGPLRGPRLHSRVYSCSPPRRGAACSVLFCSVVERALTAFIHIYNFAEDI